MAAARELPLEPVFGTFGAKATEALPIALRCGVNAVDHAELYGNAAEVGAALASIGRRDSVYLISKLSGLPDGDYAAVRQRVRALLEGLRAESVDLLLMHWPGDHHGDPTRPASLDLDKGIGSFADFERRAGPAWANMLRLRDEGLAKRVGVSNFYLQHLDALAAASGEVPYANQIFIDPSHQEQALVEAMGARGIRPLAYRCLAYRSEPEVFSAAAKAMSADVRGVVLGWLLKRGVAPVFSSSSEDHIRENLRVAAAAASLDAAALRVDAPEGGFMPDRLAALCRAHGQAVVVSPEAVQQLVEMCACDPEAARKAIADAGGDLEQAMDKLLG